MNLKKEVNVGTLWRSAYIYGASFIFSTDHRYRKQASDTTKTYKHVPYYEYDDNNQFLSTYPYDCPMVGIELGNELDSISLPKFFHPERAIYVLGAEDGGIPKEVLAKCQYHIYIPSVREICLNVAMAGTLVMYDRYSKEK